MDMFKSLEEAEKKCEVLENQQLQREEKQQMREDKKIQQHQKKVERQQMRENKKIQRQQKKEQRRKFFIGRLYSTRRSLGMYNMQCMWRCLPD